MNLRPRLLSVIDKLLALLVMLSVGGTALAFGGAVWWAPPALGAITAVMLAAWLVRCLLMGQMVILKSPLTFLGLAALGLACLQLAPLPGRVAAKLSPNARAAHALGTLPDLARADDPDAEIPEAGSERSPATIDRPATLRWLAGAAAGLALFCVCSGFADRLGHSAIVWGSVVSAFFLGTVFGLVQVTGGVSGVFGAIQPGSGKPGLPTLDDLANTPGPRVLRPIGEATTRAGAWSLERPESPFLFGTMLGGPGAYLALAALGLPLALGMTLQILAPRGSRQAMRARLRESGRTGLVVLMGLLTIAGAGLVGHLAGPILASPFAAGIVLVGLPGAWSSALRWVAVGLTVATFGALGGGVWSGETFGRPRGADALASSGLETMKPLWSETARMARDFPIVGSGLGTYPVLAPYYKARDQAFFTAQSSVLQWWAEAGIVGMAILVAAALWCLAKIPGSTRKVGTADRTLAFMLIGTLLCFGTFSAMHWTIELAAVGLAACAVGGTINRWLAGGTDLFVERA